MVKTLIIDDEPKNIKLIAGIVGEHCPELEVIGSTDNLAEALSLIENLKPALLMVDIEFPAGTIFHVLEKLKYTDFQIIFITAHNTYASEAFKQNAVDYILKPVTTEAVVQAVKKTMARLSTGNPTDISRLVGLLRSGLLHQKKIPLPSSEGILFVNETDIIHCEASGRYTILHMNGKKKLTVTKTLKEMEAQLNPIQFFRIHNSHIINLEMVRKYHRGHGGMIELNDNSMVEVSNSRKNELLDLLLNRSPE